MCDTIIRDYSNTTYNFFILLQKIFKINTSLEELHLINTENNQVTFENDTKTVYQKQFYNSELYDTFRDLYYSFVKNEIGKLFPNEEYLIIQKDPCFRVCVPNNTALGLRSDDINEKIGLHCDADYNHPSTEINYIIAITEMWDSNSVWIESSSNKGDFAPVKLYWNQYLQFYGNKLRHYNVKNISGQTRVSIDFRVIPFSKYDPNCKKESVHGKRKFVIDDYYIKMKI
jgi:hypothetical protein